MSIPVNYQLTRRIDGLANFDAAAMQNRLESVGYVVSVRKNYNFNTVLNGGILGAVLGGASEDYGTITITFTGFPDNWAVNFPDRNQQYAQAVADTDNALIFARDGGFGNTTNNTNNTNNNSSWIDSIGNWVSGISGNTNGTYKVVSGDTLSKIGAKLGVNWQTIASLNGIKSPYIIRVGQVLRITGASTNTNANTNTNATIITPQQLPTVLNNAANNNAQPQTNNSNAPQTQAQKKANAQDWINKNLFTTTGALTTAGIVGCVVIGAIILQGQSKK